MRRQGWTLHEMVISLAILGGVVALASHTAVEQLRFFRGVGDMSEMREQLLHAGTIVSRITWGAASGAGDIVVAMDSALELHAPIGSAVVCGSAPGRLTIPASRDAPGNVMGAYVATPEAGDRVVALFSDTAGATWLAFRIAAAPTAGGSCWPFAAPATWTVALREQVVVPIGAVLRFTRPIRLSTYRASDGKWYLGAKDWNGDNERFNTIQPVAGPFRPFSRDPAVSGFRFVYRDERGTELVDPVDVHRIASITLVGRASTARSVRVTGIRGGANAPYVDSVFATTALRNRP